MKKKICINVARILVENISFEINRHPCSGVALTETEYDTQVVKMGEEEVVKHSAMVT